MTFSPSELAVLRAALTVPTCWWPELREEALRLVERADAAQPRPPLPTSIRAMLDGEEAAR
jgi:hypothetical protein